MSNEAFDLPPSLYSITGRISDVNSYTAYQMRDAYTSGRKAALTEAANRTEAYAYMSKNFTALAEELRRLRDE